MTYESQKEANSDAVLVVIAHPDDELFVSGTLCLLGEHGFKTHLVCITNGDGSDSPILSQLSNREAGEFRQKELELSAHELGLSSVVFLSHADIPSEKWTEASWDMGGLESELAGRIAEIDPSLILTHGPLGGYGHTAHKQAYGAVVRAAQRCAYKRSIYSFAGRIDEFDCHEIYFDQPSDVAIDVREYRDRRAAALRHHRSQLGVFLSPIIPRNVRSPFGLLLAVFLPFSKRSRRRLPVYSAASFFNRFPMEGLVLQKHSSEGDDFFRSRLGADPRVHLKKGTAGGANR